MSDLDNRAPKGGGGGGGGGGGHGGGHGGKGGGIVPGATYSGDGGGGGGGDKGNLRLPGWAIFLIFAACLFAMVFVAVLWSIWGQELKRARISETNPHFRLWRVFCGAFYVASGLFIVVGVVLERLDEWTEWRRKKAIERMRAPTLRPEEAPVLAAARGAGNAGACAGGAGAGVGADAGAGGGASADGNGNGNSAPLPATTTTDEITKPPPTAACRVAKPER
ncbi:hypothetical protein DL767_001447 [Monosporascus sp. MG133]|nr:hypothetical protein DL767_001447 [Monosporascus sp. MG133]